MLEKLVLRDFQRHARLAIEFDPGVTTLVGRSDAGKSSVLRALRWIAFNRPAGLAFIRHGAEQAVVTLTVDGQTVQRRRSAKENTYRLDGQPLHAIGQGVPEQIAALLNVDEINFGHQHAPHFLFSDSAGQVAQALNAVVNLGAIDATLAKLAAELRRAKAVVDVAEERLATARQQRGRLAWVGEANDALLCWERKIQAGQELRRKAARLGDLLAALSDAGLRRDRLSNAMPDAAIAANAALAACQKRERTGRLAELIRGWETEEQAQCRVRNELRAAEVELAEAGKGKCPLCNRK